MTEEIKKELTKQLATVAVARKQLLEVAAWLGRHDDIRGGDPFVKPWDIAFSLEQPCEQLALVVGLLMSFLCPSGIPAENAESAKEGK